MLIFSLCLSVCLYSAVLGLLCFVDEREREGGRDGINIYIYGDEEGENLDCLLAIYRKIK